MVADATREIEKLVADIQGETNEVVSAMEEGTEQVVMGTQLVEETRQSLNKITAASAEITHLVEAIAQATIMQAQASESVLEEVFGSPVDCSNSDLDNSLPVAETFQSLGEPSQPTGYPTLAVTLISPITEGVNPTTISSPDGSHSVSKEKN